MTGPRLVPLALVAAGAVVGAATALGVPGPLRGPLVIVFVLLCPGAAIVRLLRLRDPVAELSLAVAVSLALAVLVPAATLYSGAWSPSLALAVLIALTTVLAAVDLRRRA